MPSNLPKNNAKCSKQYLTNEVIHSITPIVDRYLFCSSLKLVRYIDSAILSFPEVLLCFSFVFLNLYLDIVSDISHDIALTLVSYFPLNQYLSQKAFFGIQELLVLFVCLTTSILIISVFLSLYFTHQAASPCQS